MRWGRQFAVGLVVKNFNLLIDFIVENFNDIYLIARITLSLYLII